MKYLTLEKAKDQESFSSVDAFFFNVNSCNYTKKQMDIIYGRIDKVSFSAINLLLDKAFSIDDHKVIERIVNSYKY